MQDHALPGQGLGEAFAQVLVEPAQRQRLAVNKMHLGAKRPEDAGEFHRDEARADDRDLLRHDRQIEGVVRNDSQFGAGNRHPLRMPARCDDDMFCGDALSANIQRVRVDKRRPGIEDFATRAVQQAAIDTVQAVDFLVLGRDQLRPVVRALLDRPAKTSGIVRPGAILAGLHQQLLGHAANIDAGAAPEPLLRHAHARAMAGCDAGTPHAAGAAADHEQVEVHLRYPSLGGSNLWPPTQHGKIAARFG